MTCPSDQVLRFFRELSIMLGAGISLTKAIDSLAQNSQDEEMQLVLEDIFSMLTSGRALSAALRAYPRIFSDVSVAMIELGEETGGLVQSSGRLAAWMERDLDVRKRVSSAMVYPAFSLGLTVALTLLLFVYVIPDFLTMLTSMGAEIPLLTRMLLLLTSFLTSPLGWAAMLMGTVCAWLSLKAMWTLPGGRVAMTRLLLAVPVLGPLLKAGTLSRYAAAAETMSQCGTDLFTVTRLSATASGNSLIQTDVPRLAKAISDGHSLSAHMGDNPDIYSSLFAQLCGVGEESARMTEMFGFLRNYYEEEVNHRLGAVTALMEPLIMAVLALIVGLVVIALILPLHSFLSSLM